MTGSIQVYMVITVISIVIYVIAAVFTVGVLIVQLNAQIRYNVRFYRMDYMILAVCLAAGMSTLSIGM